MCQILSKYRDFLLPIRQRPSTGATDLKMLFNVDGFVKLRVYNNLNSRVYTHIRRGGHPSNRTIGKFGQTYSTCNVK